MAKGKKKGNSTKRGAPDHFSGFKLAFLVSQVESYQQCTDSNVVGEFYDKVTRDFIVKYGQEEPFNDNPDEDPPDPDSNLFGEVDDPQEPLSKEETEEKAAVFMKLRTKLAQWYRRKYKRPEVTKSSSTLANPLLGVLAANIGKAPRKLTPFHQYLKDYYQDRIKDEYHRRFMIAQKNYDSATKEEKENRSVSRPVALQVRSKVGNEFWLLETEEFRKKVAQDAEDAHAKEVEEWEMSRLVPKTPQQFHQQLTFAGQYLHPVAKAIASQMQAAVSICIIGPVADRNGEIEVRSVHVNWPGGLQGATWPDHDPKGYTEAEKSMVAYGRANFSVAECRRRALPVEPQDNSEIDTSYAIGQGQPPSSGHTSSVVTNDLGSSYASGGPSQIQSSLLAIPVPAPASAPVPVLVPHASPQACSSSPAHSYSLPFLSTPPPPPPTAAPATANISAPAPTTIDTGIEFDFTYASSDTFFPDFSSPSQSDSLLPDFSSLPPSDPPIGFSSPLPSDLPFPGLSSESSLIPARESSVPIDPALLGLSYPWLAEPAPRLILREESPLSRPWRRADGLEPDSGAEAANKETDRVPPPPTSSPTFIFTDSTLSLHVPTSTPIITHPIPSDWPKHMVDAYRYLSEETGEEIRTRNWGVLWQGCLEAFVGFQRHAGFPDGGPSFPPSTGVRPREIAMWMKNGRRWKDVVLDDPKSFGQRWWDWWHSLQPKSRISRYQSRSTSPALEMDWTDLRKPGRNGFLLIMISLVWWGSASNRDGSWLAAIADVAEVLTCMQNASGDSETLANEVSKGSLPVGSSAANSPGAVTPKQGRRGHVTATGGPLKKKRKVR